MRHGAALCLVAAGLLATAPGVVGRPAPLQTSTSSQSSSHMLRSVEAVRREPLLPLYSEERKSARLRAGTRARVQNEYREAVKWTVITVFAAVIFGFGIIPFKGHDAAMDYFTGFLIEKILSVDNLFVFVMLFDYFKTPEEFQRKVLTIGIASAIVLRGIMIAVGVQLVQRFRPVLLIFASILVVSSVKMVKEALRPEEEGDEDLTDNAVVKLASALVDSTSKYDGSKFFTTRNGKRQATPMLMVLLCIELSDIVFAVDSIPAIVGITQDTFIVFTSNIFAILGLRNLYVLLAKAVKDLVYLKAAVAVILGFVGVKMVLEFTGFHISSVQSLGVVGGLLAIGVVASLMDRAKKQARLASPTTLGKTN